MPPGPASTLGRWIPAPLGSRLDDGERFSLGFHSNCTVNCHLLSCPILPLSYPTQALTLYQYQSRLNVKCICCVLLCIPRVCLLLIHCSRPFQHIAPEIKEKLQLGQCYQSMTKPILQIPNTAISFGHPPPPPPPKCFSLSHALAADMCENVP